jgi:hypothetical protein
MSFLYPRTIAITRPTGETGIGAVGYGGETPVSEVPVASGLAASIQFDKDKGASDAKLPGDARKTFWKVLIPRSAAALGLIAQWDIITDDLGQRYQVYAPYWNSLGYALRVEKLEV